MFSMNNVNRINLLILNYLMMSILKSNKFISHFQCKLMHRGTDLESNTKYYFH